MKSIVKQCLGCCLALACLLALEPLLAADAAVPAAPPQAPKAFDIPAQPLHAALLDYARQANVGLRLGKAHLDGFSSPLLRGNFTPQAALEKLLAHSGVGYRYQQDGPRLKIQLYNLSVHDKTRQASLGTVYVTANARRDWIYHDPEAVSVITREDMDRAPARHAADLLITTPGVSSAVNRLDPGLSVNIRGMQDFGRVNTMIDGMRQDFVQSGHQQRNGEIYVDPELLSEVVIHRGPSSGVDGATAIAGQVDFRTLDFDDLLKNGKAYGLRLRGMAGPGGVGNGANFTGSIAGAFRLGSQLEVLAAHARHVLGDYRIGSHDAPGKSSRSDQIGGALGAIDPATGGAYKDVKFSSQHQSSNLFKTKLDLPDRQSLQFSYVGTKINYATTTPDYDDQVDIDAPTPTTSSPWKKLGNAAARTNSYALDYAWQPEDRRWIDLKAKLYWVTTQVYTNNDPQYPSSFLGSTDPATIKHYLNSNFWTGRLGGLPFCEDTAAQAQANGLLGSYCGYGLNLRESVRTQTPGLKLQNTSRFELGQETMLTANYGAEYYQDRGNSSSRRYHEGTPYLNGPGGNALTDGLNPSGRRTIASAFANLQLEDDFYTVKAGLRYDHYWARGDTSLSTNKITYRSTAERFGIPESVARAYFQHYVDQWNATYPNQHDNGDGMHCTVIKGANCLAATGHGPSDYDHQYANTINEVAPAAANDPNVAQPLAGYGYTVPTDSPYFLTPSGYVDRYMYDNGFGPMIWSDTGYYRTYQLRRHQGKYLPSFSVAIRPTGWLELYGDWARSWRPPSLDESLISGAHGGNIGVMILPNPYLKPETSRSWEIGSNMNFHHLFTDEDQLHLKIGYADTVVHNYIYSSVAMNTPTETNINGTLGNLGFVNNEKAMRFRDIELESDYDAGWVYAQLSYTHYLGGQNKFCNAVFPMGVAPTLQDLQGHGYQSYVAGSAWSNLFSPDAKVIGDTGLPHPGYATWSQWAKHARVCGPIAYNSAIAMPVDKGSGTMGFRLFRRRLDTGLRFDYSGTGTEGRGYYSGNYQTAGYLAWPAYHVLNWYASYRLRSYLKAMASVENLLDRQYVDGSGDALARTFAPGRTIQLGMEVDI